MAKDILSIKEKEAKTELVEKKSSSLSVSKCDKNSINNWFNKTAPFYYISDIHICHILMRKEINTYDDIVVSVKEIVSDIWSSYKAWSEKVRSPLCSYILFGGDVSSNHYIFELFIRELKIIGVTNAIFVLGNHEFWDFRSVNEAINWYRKIVEKYGFIFLHNEIFMAYGDINSTKQRIITQKEIEELSVAELRDVSSQARSIVLGGVGFAGCNKKFNASNGIYRNCLGKDAEKAIIAEKRESSIFESIYLKLQEVFDNKTVVVLSHNPVKDWTKFGYFSHWIYVSGHTHVNKKQIREKYREYSDNQIGYQRNTIGLRYFSVDIDDSALLNRNDGIYEISINQYYQFFESKKVSMSFSDANAKLYLIKKNGYYMFASESVNKDGKHIFSIMDGGRRYHLKHGDLQYYYDNLEREIELIKGPRLQFSNILRQVSAYVRSFGGSGFVHGCIVDIDYYNHLYVNPIDMKVTPYYAEDTSSRIAYKEISGLLLERRPDLYKQLKDNQSCKSSVINEIIVSEKERVQKQLDTGYYLYKQSNIIKRLELLESDHILTRWFELNTKEIEMQ